MYGARNINALHDTREAKVTIPVTPSDDLRGYTLYRIVTGRHFVSPDDKMAR